MKIKNIEYCEICGIEIIKDNELDNFIVIDGSVLINNEDIQEEEQNIYCWECFIELMEKMKR